MKKVGQNKWVKFTYRLNILLPDGTRQEGKTHEATILYGIQEQTATIQGALEGAQVGDELELRVPPGELFGPYRPELVKKIPKEGLIRQRIRAGSYYRQIKDSTLISFKVLEEQDDSVLADFNEPMAGISADVSLKVVDVWEATPEEIERVKEEVSKKKAGCG